MSKARVIAFYLPQYFPTPENDRWWGKGFTEWTNVGRTKPLFRGHYQPKVPADLGYYDLRVPEVRTQQAELAKEAGIEGFCYWHYWFAGQRLLDRVFKEVVEGGKPDFPFCLCWANHSWYQKTWDPNKPNRLLIEQTYPGLEDYEAHFYALLPAFKDSRYMKVNGKLIFGLFAPLDIPNAKLFKETWNKLAIKNGLNGFAFFGYLPQSVKSDKIDRVLGSFDYVALDQYATAITSKADFFMRMQKWIRNHVLHQPYIGLYKDYVNYLSRHTPVDDKILPCILPNYDHTPRSGRRGMLLHNSTPTLWGKLLENVFMLRSHIKEEENLVFIKAWNEWGEGNYLEPDLKYGKDYLKVLRDQLNV